MEGECVVWKANNRISCMTIYQAHEQNNAVVKSGGIVGIRDNPSALKSWILAGPKVSHLVHEFEAVLRNEIAKTTGHHEKSRSTQIQLLKEVTYLVDALESMGNPFREEERGMITLDTKVIRPQVMCWLDKQCINVWQI